MQFDGDGVVVVIGDLDPLAHGLAAQQADQSVGHAAVGHALDAEAVGSGCAGNGGKHGVADGDFTTAGLDLDHI